LDSEDGDRPLLRHQKSGRSFTLLPNLLSRLGTDPVVEGVRIWRPICVRHRDWDRPLSELWTPRLGTDPCCGLTPVVDSSHGDRPRRSPVGIGQLFEGIGSKIWLLFDFLLPSLAKLARCCGETSASDNPDRSQARSAWVNVLRKNRPVGYRMIGRS
jgi:hypothetical protein